MDEFICYCDAVGQFSTRYMIVTLKKKFPELAQVSFSHEISSSRGKKAQLLLTSLLPLVQNCVDLGVSLGIWCAVGLIR